LPDSPSACTTPYKGQNYTVPDKITPLRIEKRIGEPPEIYRCDSRRTAPLGFVTRFLLTDCQERRQWCPALPYLNSVHPISCLVSRLLHTSNIVLKDVAPRCDFGPLLQNPGDGPADCTLSRACITEIPFAFILAGTIVAMTLVSQH